jgi:tetratricopeptide (TPR) repeat protein
MAALLACAALGSEKSGQPPVQANLEERLILSSRWDLGYYLFQIQEYKAAAREFEKVRKILPADPTLLALIGSCYSMSGQWSKGEQALLEAIAVNPNDEDINSLLGQFYLSTGQALKGAVYLEQTLRLSPQQEELHGKLAGIYLGAGQSVQAKTHLETLLASRGGEDLGEAILNHDYARCLAQEGDFRNALKFAFKAHKAEPTNGDFARVLGLCLMGANRYGEAARMLMVSHNQLVLDADLFLQLGEAWFMDRRWELAEEAWLSGVRRYSHSYALLTALMEYYINTARPDDARDVFRYAVRRNPGHPGNLLLESKLNRKLGSYTAAGKSLGRLKRQACGKMGLEALWEEAQLYFETGKADACGKVLDRLIGIKHREADAHLLKAKLALLGGNRIMAQGHILEARKLNPYNLKVYSLAREAFTGDRDRVKLAGLLQDAVELMPESGKLYTLAARAAGTIGR